MFIFYKSGSCNIFHIQMRRMQLIKQLSGNRKKKTWFEMRHLMVTGKKIKALFTRKQTS